MFLGVQLEYWAILATGALLAASVYIGEHVE